MTIKVKSTFDKIDLISHKLRSINKKKLKLTLDPYWVLLTQFNIS